MYVRSRRKVEDTPGASAVDPSPMICQALGCAQAIPHRHLMCPTHWFELPPALQRDVMLAFGAWISGKTNLYPYMAARLAAIIYLGKQHHMDVAALETKRAFAVSRMEPISEEGNGWS